MLKVLLVDDEVWNRDILRSLGAWTELGMEIIAEAEDGEEALRLADELSPDLVITDMRMPGTDGVMLMHKLHERYPEVKLVVISGYDDFKYAQSAIRYGAADYLLKPVDPEELNSVLRKCREELDQQRAASQTYTLDIGLVRSLSEVKPKLRAAFNELNGEGVSALLHRVGRELEAQGGGQPNHGALRQAAGELLLLLQELAAANGLEDTLSLAELPTEALASGHGLTDYLQRVYTDSLELLVAQRRFKNRLNLEEVRQYVDAHFAEAVTLEGLARIFFVSKEYLSRAFKQQYECNVTDYIVGLRMEKAKRWLADESIPIKLVAEMAGYEDVGYFYRVFKKHFGIAPGEMRKNVSGLKISNPEV